MTCTLEAIVERTRLDGSRAAIESITYGELGSYIGGVARSLKRQGVQRGDVVAIQGSRTEWLVPCMLGVWHLGAAFVILDQKQPAARNEACLRQVRCRAVLDSSKVPQRAELGLGSPVRGEDFAYLAFTSGSTGTPRGVIGNHGPVEHFLEWQAQRFGFREMDRFAMLSGLGHDPLLRDILASLRIGAYLAVPADGDMRDPRLLVEWLREERVTVLHLTPSLGHLLVAGVQLTGLSLEHIRYFFFGGEPLPRKLAAACLAAAPNCQIVNFYGATETPQAMGYHVFDPGRKYETPSVPVGRGIDEVELAVEDGEIVIRTVHLSTGYWNDAESTAKRFRNGAYLTGDAGFVDRFGDVVLTNRKDSQVKISGYRVEPAEVSAVMEQHSKVLRALVLASDGVLKGYFSAENLSAGELRDWLRVQLPTHMVPSSMIRLERFPMTRNGKVDVAALPVEEERRTIRQFTSDLEARIAQLYSEVLGIKGIGPNDHFFDLGGNSLAAARLMAELETFLGRRVPLAMLLETATPETLAARLSEDSGPNWSPLVRLTFGDPELTPLFCIHAIGGNVLGYRELAGRLVDRPVFALQAIALDGQSEPDRTIDAMAARYIAEVRRVQPHGPYWLAGHSAGGLVAYEMAQRLVEAGESVEGVFLFDTKIFQAQALGAVVSWKMSRNLNEFRRLPMADKRDFLRTKWVNTWMNLRLTLARLSGGTSRDPETAFRLAERSYAVSPYVGRVFLFRTHEGTAADPEGLELGWSGVASRLEVREAAGSHYTMLAAPNVDSLAKLVQECMREVVDCGPLGESGTGPVAGAEFSSGWRK